MQWLVCRSSQWFHDRHGGIIISHWILCVVSLPRLLAVLLFTFITNPKFCSLLKKLFHRVDHFSVCFLLLSHFLFPFLSHMLFSFLLFVYFSGSFPNPFFTHLSSSFSFSHSSSSSSYYYYYPFLSSFPLLVSTVLLVCQMMKHVNHWLNWQLLSVAGIANLHEKWILFQSLQRMLSM